MLLGLSGYSLFISLCLTKLNQAINVLLFIIIFEMEIHQLFAGFLHSNLSFNSPPNSPRNKILQCFNAKEAPEITIEEFLDRFAIYLKTDSSTYVVANILIERLIKLNPDLFITPLNIHRLLVTAITLTEKILNDFYWRNTDYAIVGAITNEELNVLEAEFIKGIDYDLKIEKEEYEDSMKRICGISDAKSDL